MKRNTKRDALLKKWATLQKEKQNYVKKLKNTSKKVDELNSINAIQDKQYDMINKHNPVEFLSYSAGEDSLKLYFDGIENFIDSGIQSYYRMNQLVSEIESNQNKLINECSGSTANTIAVINTLEGYSNSEHCDTKTYREIKLFFEDYNAIDRTAIQKKLNDDLKAINSELSNRHNHAWESYNNGKEQGLRDACTHMREIIDYFLKNYCNIKQLKVCTWYDSSKPEPKRWDKFYFLIKEIAKLNESDPDYKNLTMLAAKLADLMDYLSSLTHWGPKDKSKVESLIIQTEDFLLMLFKNGVEPFNAD